MLRVVLDTNVLVSAAIGSPQGASAVLLAAAQSGEITILACTGLIDELSDTLGRPHLRKRISQDEADAYVDGVTLLAEWVDDRRSEQIPRICADSEDDFLVALYQDGDAAMLISGDRAVQQITYPNVYVYTPVEAIKVLARRREQGANYLPGQAEDFRRHVEAEGHRPLVTLYAHLHRLLMLGSPEELETKLPALVVPDALAGFRAEVDAVRELLTDRALYSRPSYAAPDIAHLRLPPDTGELIRYAESVVLPQSTIFVTVQRCPDLDDPPWLSVDHWRIYNVGVDPVPPHAVPKRPLA